MEEMLQKVEDSLEPVVNYTTFLLIFAGPTLFSTALTAPMDRVKLLLQSQDVHPEIRKGEVARLTNISSGLRRLVQEEGFISLWNGNAANMFRYGGSLIFNMELRDKIRHWIPQIPMESYRQEKSVNKMLTNGITATASTLLTLPFEYAHVRLAGSFIPFANTRSSGIVDSWMKTATPGLGVFRGAFPTVAHSIIHRSAHLTYFDALTKLNPYGSRKDSIGLAFKYITSQTSALLALFLAYPLDTVRVRMQMEANLAPADRLYNSSLDCIKKIFTEGGYSAFFKGFSAAAVKSIGGAIAVVWYNELRQLYDQKL